MLIDVVGGLVGGEGQTHLEGELAECARGGGGRGNGVEMGGEDLLGLFDGSCDGGLSTIASVSRLDESTSVTDLFPTRRPTTAPMLDQ